MDCCQSAIHPGVTMPLSIRPVPYELPTYSLTGDLMGFLRCPLQYRYQRIGRLPPSEPVQQWFGEFIHGVLEEGYRTYKASGGVPPWPQATLDAIVDLITARLSARGLVAMSTNVKQIASDRARAAIQELGPYLFSLIIQAEVRVAGARMLPAGARNLPHRRADRYEMAGVVDVVTEVALSDPKLQANPLVQAIRAAVPDLPPQFEIIVDYKGSRRPSLPRPGKAGYWTQYAWQLQTYAYLRSRQGGQQPVVAGVLLYLNELAPTRKDLAELKRDIRSGLTDVVPLPGSVDAKALVSRSPRKGPVPALSFEFRLARAIRVEPVTTATIQTALTNFDTTVESIEGCYASEFLGSTVQQAWQPSASDPGTCAACDSKTYCKGFQATPMAAQGFTSPRLPGT